VLQNTRSTLPLDPAALLEARAGRRSLELTGREDEILRLVYDGLSDKEIARRLAMSPRTVRTHMEKVFRKWGVSSRYVAARIWAHVKDSRGRPAAAL
jgi:DNA-binding CsgD family transcriptional regulator